MRSVDVVFPASMCAIIPMLRVSSSLNALPIVPETAFFSPVRLLETLQRIVVALLRHLIHRDVKPPLRRRLLAFPHHRADELLHDVAGIDRIGRLCSPEYKSFAWHCSLSLLQNSLRTQLFNETVDLLRRRCLRPLGPILRTSLLAVLHARSVQGSAHDVIPHSRQILYAAPAHQHDRVLLQVVADAGNIRRYFNRIRQPHACHFAQRRVRFLRRLRVHANAYTALLRTARQRRRLRLHPDRFTSHPYQLRKRRHSRSSIAPMNFRGSRKARTQNDARAQSSAERSTANPEIQPARNSVRTPRSRTNLLASVRRGLLGFAGLAPHSGRSSVPFPLTLFRDGR